MTQLLAHQTSLTARLGLEASSTIALRARALRREVSQWVAAPERGEERSVKVSAHRAMKTTGRSRGTLNCRFVLAALQKTKSPACFFKPLTSASQIELLRGPGPSARPASSPKKARCTSGRPALKLPTLFCSTVAQSQEALANHSLNRTFCCGRPLAIISFLAKRQPPQNAG